jgi:hypothetical protein
LLLNEKVNYLRYQHNTFMTSFSLKWYSLFKTQLLLAVLSCCSEKIVALNPDDTTSTSTQLQAQQYLAEIKELPASAFWPNIKPELFFNNVKDDIDHPLNLYEGNNTNFCSYGALSYLPLHDDPLRFAQFMIELYREGKAQYNKIWFEPSKNVRVAAGTLQYKGKLDIRPAEQVWILCLADRFKGYLNLFNRNYKSGDENTFWASTNYGKFNRMIKKLFNYDMTSRGSDLLRPWIKKDDLVEYLQNKLRSGGTTFLYINNTSLRKKNHNLIRSGIPTHYIVLISIEHAYGDIYTIIYWDYGLRSLRQVSLGSLKKIIFGITHCTKKVSHE